MSGNLAAYGLIAHGFKNYLDWVNVNDPIVVDGRPRDIRLVVRDDGYAAVRTIALVDQLIQSGDIFSILTLGRRTRSRCTTGSIRRAFPIPS